jgi:hypothetical protein
MNITDWPNSITYSIAKNFLALEIVQKNDPRLEAVWRQKNGKEKKK